MFKTRRDYGLYTFQIVALSAIVACTHAGIIGAGHAVAPVAAIAAAPVAVAQQTVDYFVSRTISFIAKLQFLILLYSIIISLTISPSRKYSK